jgi:3-hydroxyacyl-[acyl-carrier-protein] dehydratase
VTVDIERILPHRAPMLLVDDVVTLVPGTRVTARTTVDTADYPAVLVVESWCQAAGILATCDQPSPDVLTGRVMLIGSLAGVRILGPVRPGNVIEHRVRQVRALPDAVVFDGDAVVGGSTVLDVERLVMTLRPAAELRAAQSGEAVRS